VHASWLGGNAPIRKHYETANIAGVQTGGQAAVRARAAIRAERRRGTLSTLTSATDATVGEALVRVIGVRTVVASVANPVSVGVLLTDVRDIGAIIDDVRNGIPISVG
jgi:hypothetical protein